MDFAKKKTKKCPFSQKNYLNDIDKVKIVCYIIVSTCSDERGKVMK